MLVNQAKDVARQWVIEEASKAPGFCGAFFHGSTNWLPDEAALPTASDVDIMVVLADRVPPNKLGKLIYRDVLLDVSYLPAAEVQSPDLILGQSHMAGSFRSASIILDPSGGLARIQAAVAAGYAKRRWVRKRCEHVVDKILLNLQGLGATEPFHDQVLPWLFAMPATMMA